MRRASAAQHIQHHLIHAPDASPCIDEHKRAPQLPPSSEVLLNLLAPLLLAGEAIAGTIDDAQPAAATADEIPRGEVLGLRIVAAEQRGAEAGLELCGDAGAAVDGAAHAKDVHNARAAWPGADEGEFAAGAAAVRTQ